MQCLDKQTLRAGDYSVVGLEQVVAVERKSLADFYSCLTLGRERFENALHRLAAVRYPLVVLECSMNDLQEKFTYVASGGIPMESQVCPLVAQSSLLSWQARYRIPIVPCGNRDLAARVVLQHFDVVVRLVHDESGLRDSAESMVETPAVGVAPAVAEELGPGGLQRETDG